MATAATGLMKAEEFYQWTLRPENRDRFFELERGEIVEMPPPSKYHGFVCGNVARVLGNFAAQKQSGYVCTNDSGLIVERDPDTVRGPDVSVYEDAQTADTMDRQFAVQPPKLVVEVLSPSDRMGKVTRRITQYLRRGVQMVWLVDPEARDVTVYRPGQDPLLVEQEGELTGENVLPDFRCRLAEFFGLPGK